MDGWRQHTARGRRAVAASQSGRGDAGSPVGSTQGALSTGHEPKQEESERSSLAHPSGEQGRGTQAKERRCGRGAEVSRAAGVCSLAGAFAALFLSSGLSEALVPPG